MLQQLCGIDKQLDAAVSLAIGRAQASVSLLLQSCDSFNEVLEAGIAATDRLIAVALEDRALCLEQHACLQYPHRKLPRSVTPQHQLLAIQLQHSS